MTALPPPGPPDGPSRLDALRSALTERLGLKATAIFIAVMLWFIVAGRQPTEAYVRVKVMPSLDSTLVLLDAPAQLEALVSGRAVDIVKLQADPPSVHRQVGGDAPDTLVLDVSPADVRVPASLTNVIRILDVQPRSVMLRFGTRATRRVPVTGGGRILVRDDTLLHVSDAVEFEPATVRITGPRRAVRRITSVHPYSLNIVRGDTLRHVADLDTTGLGIRVLPPQVKVLLRASSVAP